VTWDAHCAALFGLSLRDFDGTIAAFAAAVHPDDRPKVAAAVRGSVEHALPMDVAYRAVWPDGTVRHLISRGKALPGADGRVQRILGASVDITELQWAVLELQKAVEAQSSAARRLAALADAALQLATATSVDELTAIVIDRGAKALGADGGAIAVRDDASGTVRLSITGSLGERTQVQYAELPHRPPAAGGARRADRRDGPAAHAGVRCRVVPAHGRRLRGERPVRLGDRADAGRGPPAREPRRELDRRARVQRLRRRAADGVRGASAPRPSTGSRSSRSNGHRRLRCGACPRPSSGRCSPLLRSRRTCRSRSATRQLSSTPASAVTGTTGCAPATARWS
jgi:PAS domain-containing protein